jgi:hypothetical protein
MGSPMLPTFGGADRVLSYSVNAVCELEERSARNLGQLLLTLQLNVVAPSFAACRWLVWAGLLHDDAQFQKLGVPSLTPAQVGDWLHAWLTAGHTLGELGPIIAAALEQSGLIGTRKGEAEGNARPEATTGSPSPTSGSPTGSPA